MVTPFDPNKIEIYNPNTGTISYAGDIPAPIAPSGRLVNIVDKNGKSMGSIEESEVPKLLKQGYHIETSQEKEVNDYLEQNKGLAGDLKAGAYSAANELSFGALDPAVKGLSSPETLAKIRGLQRDHKLASGIGTGAGLAGSLAVGGGLFKGAATLGRSAEAAILGSRAAEAGLGLRSLGAAARMGVEGAVLSAPSAVSEATFGDPKLAAEHLLFGLGSGAALGAVTPTIKGAGKYLINGIGKPFGYQLTEKGIMNDLRNMSEDQAVRSIFSTSSKQLRGEVNQLKREGINVGRDMIDNGLVPRINEDVYSMAERTAAYKQLMGEELGRVVNEVKDAKVINRDNLISKLDDLLENKYGSSAAYSTEYDRGKAYINKLDSQLAKFDGSTQLEQSYITELAKLDLITDPFQKEAQAKLVNSMRDQLVLENNNVTLGRLWRDSSELGGKANKTGAARTGDGDEISELLNDFRREIRDTIKAEGTKVAESRGIPNWVDQFETANKKFRSANLIDNIAQHSADSSSTRNFSITDSIFGSAIAGGNIAGALSNPVGLATGVVGGMAHKFLRENGNAILSKYSNNIALYLADMAQKEASNQIGRIPKMLKSMAKNTFSSGGVLETGNAISRFLGTDEKNEEKSYNDLVYRLENSNSNNEYAKVLDNGTPNISAAYRDANNNVVTYLKNNLPKNPNADLPFADKWKPSKRQLKDLNDKVSVINNPYTVIDKLQDGTLNKNHMDALKGVYPGLHNNVITSVKQYGYENPNMPYNKKVRLSLLTGIPLDSSIKNVNKYQSLYKTDQPKPVANGKLNNIPGAQYTDIQRINNGIKS